MTKACTKCGVEKDPSEFYSHPTGKDGLLSCCKTCKRKYASRHGKTDQAKRLKAKRRGTVEGKAKRREYAMREDVKARARARNATPEAKARNAERGKRRDKTKMSAKAAVDNEVRRGRMPKASSLFCADCDGRAADYHHPSYDAGRWLDVVALCRPCHSVRHATGNL